MQLTTQRYENHLVRRVSIFHNFATRNFYVIDCRRYQTLHNIFESPRSPVIIKKPCTNILIGNNISASALRQRAFYRNTSHTRNVQRVLGD